MHLVMRPTEQRGDLSRHEAMLSGALRASLLMSLMIVALLETRRHLAYDEPAFVLSDVVEQWAEDCRDAIRTDPTLFHSAEKADARTWAMRAIHAMDGCVEDRAREQAEALAVDRVAALLALLGHEMDDDATAWAQAVARGVLATYLTNLDHGVTV